MKVIIYIVCFFVLLAIQTALANIGIILGGIPIVLLYLGTFALAGFLCKCWDNRNNTNN